MDIKEIGVNARNCVDSSHDSDYCECGIEPQSPIKHGVGFLVFAFIPLVL